MARKTEVISFKSFCKYIAILETAKRDDIPEETIKVWYQIIADAGFTEQDLENKVKQLCRKQSFGNTTIRIDDFFTDEKLYTYSEMKNFVRKQIKRIIQDGERILKYHNPKKSLEHYFLDFFKLKAEDVKLAVANQISKSYELERRQFFEELVEAEKLKELQKLKEISDKVKRLSWKEKEILLNKLIKAGEIVIENESLRKYYIDYLHLFADKLQGEL